MAPSINLIENLEENYFLHISDADDQTYENISLKLIETEYPHKIFKTFSLKKGHYESAILVKTRTNCINDNQS